MAGEWIAIDVGLETKPEVLELVDITGATNETVCWRLVRLWGWAATNCAEDGRAKITPDRLGRVIGADGAFVRSVAAVGWLSILEGDTAVEIPRFADRFSKSAKSRQLTARRQREYRERKPETGETTGETDISDPVTHQRYAPVTADRYAPVTHQRYHREERDRGETVPHPREGAALTNSKSPSGTWEDLRTAWNAGSGARWRSPRPPAGALDRLAEPDWFALAMQAIAAIPAASYFKTPPTLIQFCAPDFAARLASGDFVLHDKRRTAADAAKPPKAHWLQNMKPAPYRRPKESAALAASLKVPDEKTA